MNRVGPELDGLMWTLAEEGNERAIDEFGARHPELRGELLHRMSMVKGLRGAKKPQTVPRASIPRFVPREPKATPIQSRGPAVLVGGLVLAAIAAATFTFMTFLTPPVRPQPSAVNPKTTPKQSKTVVPVVPKVDTSPITEPDVVAKGNVSEATNVPVTLRVESAPLFKVLDMISLNCGIKVVPAPGMPNPSVAVDFERMSAMDMLADLGKRYGFTAFDQHDGSILVVPAVDKSGQTITSGDQGSIHNQKIGG